MQEAALSQGRKSKLSSSSFCVPNWWYFEKKTTQKKKASKEFVVGQELCFAVPCIVAWAGGSGAAVFAGTTGANQGVLCQGPLKDQACSWAVP